MKKEEVAIIGVSLKHGFKLALARYQNETMWSEIRREITKSDIEEEERIKKLNGEITELQLQKFVVLKAFSELATPNAFESSFSHYHNHPENLFCLIFLLFSCIRIASITEFRENDEVTTHYYLFFIPENVKVKGNKKGLKVKLFDPEKILTSRKRITNVFSPFVTHLVGFLVRNKDLRFNALETFRYQLLKREYLTHEIFPYVWRYSFLSDTMPPNTTTNCYVIGKDHQFIVDPGALHYKYISNLESYIKDNTDRIDGIILTHHHNPNISQAPYLKEKYDIPIFASATAASILKNRDIAVTQTLKHGDKLRLGEEWYLTVLETPGHTSGSISLWDEKRKILFCGDLLFTLTQTYVDPAYGDIGDLIRSLQDIKSLPFKFVLPGHGDMMDAKTALRKIDQNISFRKKFNSIVKRLVEQGYSTLEEISAKIAETSSLPFYIIIETTKNHLFHLAATKKIIKRGDLYLAIKRKLKFFV